MSRHVVHNTIFLIQSAVLTGILIFVTVSTKPSDVYKRLDVMEGKILNKVNHATAVAEMVDGEVSSIRLWNKETNQQLLKIQKQIDINSQWIKERTVDRWTSKDHKKWEKAKFGEVLEIEQDPIK